MVHAQFTCRSAELQEHAGTNAYLIRTKLDKERAGDVYAAMCSFGICATNGSRRPVEDAAGEKDKINQVERKVIRNCKVQFDAKRDAALYDPREAAGARAIVSEEGVISSRFTGAGAHFVETTSKDQNQATRLRDAVAKVQKAYCQPQADAPGGKVIAPFALDSQDRVYVLDQGAIGVPVLTYDGKVCIDYTSNAIVEGIRVIYGANGIPRRCSTRDLYCMVDIDTVCKVQDDGTIYTRRVSAGEGHGTQHGTVASLVNLEDWLIHSREAQHAVLGLDGQAGDIGTADLGVMETEEQASDRSLLGGPLPVMIVTAEGGSLRGTVRVAPLLVHAGTKHTATMVHDGPVDTELLADRMSRTGGRNVIGVAMQKIAPNTQGDLMLHDGV